MTAGCLGCTNGWPTGYLHTTDCPHRAGQHTTEREFATMTDTTTENTDAATISDSTVTTSTSAQENTTMTDATQNTDPAANVLWNGREYAANSLIGETVTHLAAMSEYDRTRPMLERTLDALIVQNRLNEEERTRAANLRDRALNTQRELDEFRTQVRDLILEKANAGSICNDGANRALERLGLDPMEREFAVYVNVTLQHSVRVDVTAVDEDAAADMVDEDEVRSALRNDTGVDPRDLDDFDYDVSHTEIA